MSGDEYLSVDTEGHDGTGPAVAAVLDAVAQTLEDAPEGYRYDFELIVEERAPGGGGE